jgi:hypothetical protein
LLTVVLLALAFLTASAAALFWIGNGSFHRGKLRTVRRIRTARRRHLDPLRSRLKRTAMLAWSGPVRSSVDRQIRRVADRVERASAGAEQFVAAEHGLLKALAKLEELRPPEWAETWRPRPSDSQSRARRPVRGRGWVSGLVLGLLAVAVAAGNGWLVYQYVVPTLPELYLIPDNVDPLTIGLAFAVLPFLLGLVYYAMRSAGTALGLQALAAVVVLLVLALGAAEGAAVVLALEAIGFVELSWWGGIGVATVLGGTAGLVAPTIAALAHSASDRFDDWMVARERQRADGETARQDQMVGRLRQGLDAMTSGVQTLVAELRALGAEPAGQLILDPGSRPTVERTGAVLRRLAMAVDRDGAGMVADGTAVPQARPADIAIRVLGHLFGLGIWVVAAAGALAIAATGLRTDPETGVTAIMVGSAFAALAALVVGGLVLRVLFASPGVRLGPTGRAIAVLFLGVAILSLAAILAPLTAAADGGVFDGRPLVAGAWLNLMVLVAAMASTQLREGVAAAASVVTWSLAGVARLTLGILDLTLAAVDRLLTGRRAARRRPPASRGAARRLPTPGAAAGGR